MNPDKPKQFEIPSNWSSLQINNLGNVDPMGLTMELCMCGLYTSSINDGKSLGASPNKNLVNTVALKKNLSLLESKGVEITFY